MIGHLSHHGWPKNIVKKQFLADVFYFVLRPLGYSHNASWLQRKRTTAINPHDGSALEWIEDVVFFMNMFRNLTIFRNQD
jgi:hypothetical protein